MAFFAFGNAEIELIEPNEHPSCWREFLEKNGSGCHHLALKVKGMKEKVAAFEAGGLERHLSKQGQWRCRNQRSLLGQQKPHYAGCLQYCH
jgi:4-hydroxyphenylpyruvate dioxygenase-like putative hemolysin